MIQAGRPVVAPQAENSSGRARLGMLQNRVLSSVTLELDKGQNYIVIVPAFVILV